MIERAWTVTISWGSDGRDLDIYSAVNAGGQTSSGVGWHNGEETSKIVVNDGQVNGTFYAIWGGDDTSSGGAETVTIYFRGTSLPTGSVEVATLTTHLNFYGEGSAPVTITVSNQAGSYEGSANTRYSNRANTSDPSITVPILADGGSATSMYIVELSSMPQGNGMASGGGLFANGASCSAKATPKSGATFLGWYEGGTLVSSDNPYTFTVGSDRSLVAHFSCHVEVDSETVPQPASGGGGTVSGGGDLAPGSSCTVIATPYSGYDFINWTNNRDSTTITTPTHTFTVDGDVTWTAHFERKHVWVWVDQFPKRPTIVAEPHLVPAEPAPITLRRYYYGDTVGVTVPYDPEGWRFTGWTFPGNSSSTDRTAQFQLNDETIEAVKEYDQSLQDYAVHIKANFYYYALGRLRLYLYVNNHSTNTIGAKLEPIEWEDEFQRNFVYIDESTDTRFDARVPYYATPMVLPGFPKLPGAWVVSRCEVEIHTLNQGDRTTEFNPSTTPDPERRLYDLANYFGLDSDHHWIIVRFYITRQKTYLPLCTGTDATDGGESGRILCDASGRILYDG